MSGAFAGRFGLLHSFSHFRLHRIEVETCAALHRQTQRGSSRCALADEKVRPFLEGKEIVKVVVVPGKLVSVVVK